jgi:2-polyprenyl-3-methyl-5-hydroxy-6-metoxy-1,4-benzoquinol methylase
VSESPTGPDRPDPKAHVIGVQETFAGRFDAWYKDLDADPYRSTFTYGRMKGERFIEAALDRLPAGARVLDVGCGTGFHVARLRERGFDVVGVEPGEELRRRARANNPDAEIVDGDMEDLAFEDASFDGVLAVEVIRHVPHPDLAVAEAARVLRPGGLAIITAAPKWSLNGYALINQVTSRVQVPTFTKQKQHFLTPPEARRLFRSAGFSSVEMHGVLLGPWQVVGRISPRLLGASLRAFEPVDERLSDLGPVRGLTNQLVIVAQR